MEQEIRFCTAADGTRIAWAASGHGPALVKAANWLNHLEFDWESPIWRHVVRGLTERHSLLRYDERGNGLSDWDCDDISFEAFVSDLEAVVDAAGLERFALLGISQGCAVSVAYAVRHPERVTHLVLHGGFAQGWARRGDEELRRHHEAQLTLIRQGWGTNNPAFRQMFTSLFVPGATQEQREWFNELQRVSTSPENAVRLQRAFSTIDVLDLLPQVKVPTLVLHCRNEARIPFSCGRQLASGIPGARFVVLDSSNHLVLEHEPAWPRFIKEITSFLGTATPLPADTYPTAGATPPTMRRSAPSDTWSEADRLFEMALRLPPAEHRRWLDQNVANPELRAQVARLLKRATGAAGDLQTGGALDGPLGDELAEAVTGSEGAALNPGDRVGTYEIVELVATGGMGAVYRARHPSLGREVAVKALPDALVSDPASLARFQREARVLASLDHPNIATIHDLLSIDRRPYLILEFVEGETLTNLIARGPVPREELLAIASQITSALVEAHGKGIVHRDLKPDNVKLTPEGRVKVLDFGLAKSLESATGDPDATESFATRSNIILGTPGYMSPEQARRQKVDTRTDVWAFGCILYEMMTGSRAFAGNTMFDAMAAILRDEADWSRVPEGTPAELIQLADRCLQKDVERRLQAIDEARSQLAAIR